MHLELPILNLLRVLTRLISWQNMSSLNYTLQDPYRRIFSYTFPPVTHYLPSVVIFSHLLVEDLRLTAFKAKLDN